MADPGLDDYINTAEFRVLFEHYMRAARRIVGHHGLTPQRYLLLLLIKGAPDGSESSTVTELSRRLELAQHTTTGLVKRTVETGFIKKTTGAGDRRVVNLTLTKKGERVLASAFSDLAPSRQAFREMVVRAGGQLQVRQR